MMALVHACFAAAAALGVYFCIDGAIAMRRRVASLRGFFEHLDQRANGIACLVLAYGGAQLTIACLAELRAVFA